MRRVNKKIKFVKQIFQKMETTFTKYIEKITEICPQIKEEHLEQIRKNFSIISIAQKQHYIKAGELQSNIGYIVNGLIRAYYIDENGNEVTVNFLKEGDYATHYPALKENAPSKFYFQSIEPTTIINIPYKFLVELCNESHPVERYLRTTIEEVFAQHLNRIEGFLFENAEQRYINFIKNNPDIFNRISISDLSTYLGIERQSLTRIRKKILSK